jgi:hypothetical protein
MCTNPSRLKIDLVASMIFLFEAAGPSGDLGTLREHRTAERHENSKSYVLGLRPGPQP